MVTNVGAPTLILVGVDATVLYETEAAIRIDYGGDSPVWLPKSKCEDWPDIGDHGTVIVEEWLALDKGII